MCYALCTVPAIVTNYLLFVLLVNRLSQIGAQPTTSLDQKQYPKYELSLCKCVCVGVCMYSLSTTLAYSEY